jgi:thiamine biosynthesis lipoprotein
MLTRPLSRRGACALLAAAFAGGCASREAAVQTDAAWERYEFTRPQMGVPFRIVVWSTNEPIAQKAAGAAFARVAELNAALSDYDPDSEINRLTRETPVGEPARVSDDVWVVLSRSQQLARATDGAFDVTVGPLVNLWRRARRHRELPPERLLEEARARSGWQYLELLPSERAVVFRRRDMRLDFGGIAKGFAADEALRVLRDHGLPRAMVAAAGDLRVGMAPPDERGWRVEVGETDIPGAPQPRTVWLENAAVATSGDIFQRLEIEGRRYSHILDPRTGIGLTDHSLVVVLARDGMTADSLATAVSVLGPEEGLRLADRTPGAAALVLRAPEGRFETRTSRRFKRWVE